MEKSSIYLVEITQEAERHFLDLLSYLYKNQSMTSADRKSKELLEEALSLKVFPARGRIEENLASLETEHRFLLYSITKQQKVKIIYITDETKRKVYITDFFPCLMHPEKIQKR